MTCGTPQKTPKEPKRNETHADKYGKSPSPLEAE